MRCFGISKKTRALKVASQEQKNAGILSKQRYIEVTNVWNKTDFRAFVTILSIFVNEHFHLKRNWKE